MNLVDKLKHDESFELEKAEAFNKQVKQGEDCEMAENLQSEIHKKLGLWVFVPLSCRVTLKCDRLDLLLTFDEEKSLFVIWEPPLTVNSRGANKFSCKVYSLKQLTTWAEETSKSFYGNAKSS